MSEEVASFVLKHMDAKGALVRSCCDGSYSVVEFLLTKCHVVVDQVYSIDVGGKKMEDAPALWCAAAAGHIDIVQLLVRLGANVNITMRTNSTPLRAACFGGHFEIVRYLVNYGADFEAANRHGHTCLMIACYKRYFRIAQYLLSLNADVNRCSVKGNTALHDCAESGSLDILQLLLKHGATMDVDYYGMTPLLAASVNGHLPIVEHLISLPSVKREDRINALELLGATYVDKKLDMLNALSLWRRAMEDRNLDQKIPKIVSEPIAAYEFVTEVTNIDALDELVMDPDGMRMQALLIRQRILGPMHPDTSYYIRFRGLNYASAGRFDRCIELWTYALTMQQKILQPLSPKTQSSLLSFFDLFSFMVAAAGRPLPRGHVVAPIEARHMLMIFNKAVLEVERGQLMFHEQSMPVAENDQNALSRAFVSALHIGNLLAYQIDDEDFSPKMKHEILTALYKFINLKVAGRSGRTALHYACYREGKLGDGYPECRLPFTKALLMVGADPNAKDFEGNTPLHLAARAKPNPCALAKILLDHGAHLDTKNSNGETFETLLKTEKIHEIVNPIKYTTLKCLAANTIQKHRIKYEENVPECLYAFIESH